MWLPADSTDFPLQLRHPELGAAKLDVAGDRSLLKGPAIAIVGSRDASEEAFALAEMLGKVAAERGLVVVSGGARGIDWAAHEGALAAGGCTVCVLPRALNDALASGQRRLLRRIVAEKGALVTELEAGSRCFRSTFIERNRLIAGLAQIVLVVRAKLSSGALSTARWAQRWPRPLWVIPGAPWDERSVGVNQLLLAGARPIVDRQSYIAALEEHFGSALGPAPPIVSAGHPILSALATRPMRFEDLSVTISLPVSELASQLLRLELSGRIRRVNGVYRLAT